MWQVAVFEGTGWYAEKNPPLYTIDNLSKGRAFALGYWIAFREFLRFRYWISIRRMPEKLSP